MGKRKRNESETEYLRRKFRKLEKKLRKLSASPPPTQQSPSPTPPPRPPSPSTPSPSTSVQQNNSDSQRILDPIEASTLDGDDVLPEELLIALGTEGEESEERGPEIRPELSARWKKLMATGLEKDDLDKIAKKYPAPSNFCSEPPKINPEIAVGLSEVSQKRDKRIIHRQNLTLKAMNALGRTLTSVLKGNIQSNLIVEQVHDAAKLCAEIFYEDSSSRKFFALSGANNTIKEAVKDSIPDELIFGKDCAEKIKAAQTIKKTGAQIKNPDNVLPGPSTKPVKQLQPKKQGNWRGPPQQHHYHQRVRGGHRPPPTMRSTRKYNQPPQSRQEYRHYQPRGRHTYRR